MILNLILFFYLDPFIIIIILNSKLCIFIDVYDNDDQWEFTQISLSIRAVPDIIFSELLLLAIPNDNFINIDSRVADENRQNSSVCWYIGGGFDKKSIYKVGNCSCSWSVFEVDPSKKFLVNEQPCSSNPFNFIAFSVAFSSSNVATKDNLSKAILFLATNCLHAFKKTAGWKSSARSNSSSFNRSLWAFIPHCLIKTSFLPNFLIHYNGSSHSE